MQLKSQAEQNQDSYQLELDSSKELKSRLNQCQVNIQTKDLQLDDLKSTLELLQQKHYILIDENKKVNAEVDRHLKIIEQLTGLNKDIEKEMLAFNEQDQKIRQILNRENEMTEHISSNEAKLQKSRALIAHLVKKDF